MWKNCLSVSAINLCEDLSEVVSFFCSWWVVGIFDGWVLQVIVAHNTCGLFLDDIEPGSLFWALTIWEGFFLSPKNFNWQEVQTFEGFSQPPFFDSLVLRSSPFWRKWPVNFDDFWVEEWNSVLQSPERNASVTSSAVKKVDVLDVLSWGLVKFLSWRSVPIEQVAWAYFIWPFSDKNDFAISVDSNVSADDVLTNWRSDSCCVPGFGCFDYVPDDLNTLLWSEENFSVNGANVVSNHLGILEIGSAFHAAAESLDWNADNSLWNGGDETWINTTWQEERQRSVGVESSSHGVDNCGSDSVQMLLFGQFQSSYVVNPLKVITAEVKTFKLV